MSVTPRTVRSRADERRHRLSDQVVPVKVLERHDGRRCRTVIIVARAEESEGRRELRLLREKHVGSQLFADESVPRSIMVQAVDDIIAEAPGIWSQSVVLKSVSVGEVDRVQPVSRPALAIARRVQ